MSVIGLFMQSRAATPAATPDAPTSIGVYEYAGGTRFGISWTANASVSHELFRDGVLHATVGSGASTYDVGLKAGDGSHTWKVRANDRGAVSAFSSDVITTNGVSA